MAAQKALLETTYQNQHARYHQYQFEMRIVCLNPCDGLFCGNLLHCMQPLIRSNCAEYISLNFAVRMHITRKSCEKLARDPVLNADVYR